MIPLEQGGCLGCDAVGGSRVNGYCPTCRPDSPAPPEAGKHTLGGLAAYLDKLGKEAGWWEEFKLPTPPAPDRIGELVNDVARLESRSFRANERLAALEKRVVELQDTKSNANPEYVDMTEKRLFALEHPAPSAAEATRGEAITLHRNIAGLDPRWNPCQRFDWCRDPSEWEHRTAHFDAPSSPQEGKETNETGMDRDRSAQYCDPPSPRDGGKGERCAFVYPSGDRCNAFGCKYHNPLSHHHAFVPPAPSSESGEEKPHDKDCRDHRPTCYCTLTHTGEWARPHMVGECALTPSASSETPDDRHSEGRPERLLVCWYCQEVHEKNGVVHTAHDGHSCSNVPDAYVLAAYADPIIAELRAEYEQERAAANLAWEEVVAVKARAALDRAKVLAVEKVLRGPYITSESGRKCVACVDVQRALAGEGARP